MQSILAILNMFRFPGGPRSLILFVALLVLGLILLVQYSKGDKPAKAEGTIGKPPAEPGRYRDTLIAALAFVLIVGVLFIVLLFMYFIFTAGKAAG